MSHTIRDKQKLLSRVHRIQGQLAGVERALQEGGDCFKILQTVAACRGAINGLTAEIMEGHIRHHVLDAGHESEADRREAAEQIIDVVKAYLK